jgi:hypothetical protein
MAGAGVVALYVYIVISMSTHSMALRDTPRGENGGFGVDFYTLTRCKRFIGGNFHLMRTNLLNGGFEHHFEWLMVEIPTPMGGQSTHDKSNHPLINKTLSTVRKKRVTYFRNVVPDLLH